MGKLFCTLLFFYCFTTTNPVYGLTLPANTDALLIKKNGKIVHEEYFNNYDKNKAHLLWSVTKSTLNALTGIAVKEKKLSLNDSICKYLSEAKKNDLCSIQVEHLLFWTSGLNWKEIYAQDPLKSSVVGMLYNEGKRDMAKYVLNNHSIEHTPGIHFSYSSGDSVVLSAVLGKIFPKQDYSWSKLMLPIGIQSFSLERDGKGTFVGSSWGYLTARDLAKFGETFMNENNPLFPKDWIRKTVKTPSSASLSMFNRKKPRLSAGHWHVNAAKNSEGKLIKRWPEFPADMFMSRGYAGQELIVIPSKKLSIVRFGSKETADYNPAPVLKEILAKY